MKLSRPFVLFAALNLTACSTSPRRSLDEVNTLVSERAGLQLNDVAPDPAALLAVPLTAETAARIALARNPAFKTKLEEVGLAQADLAQAGIIENPRLHGALRLVGGHSGSEGHELGVKINLLDLFDRPLRRRVASQRLEQAKSRLGHEVLGLAADARTAFYAHVAAVERLKLRRDSLESLDAAVALAERQRQAGNISRLDLANERAAREEAAADLAREEAYAAQARERLAMLLAIQDKTWTAESALPDVPAADPAPEAVEAAAIAQRWDLQAARRDPQVLKDALAVERMRLFGPIEIGVDSEREYSGESKYGPEFEVGLPIFERRQASRARLHAQRRQSLASADALETSIRYEARAVSAELASARKTVEAYAKAVPHRREALMETLKNNNYMLLGVYHLLEAKRREIEASSAYVDALKDYWTKRSELERVAGGKLPPAKGE
jgi:cobalt-zinc-cadmium efflux system outer membrane protein